MATTRTAEQILADINELLETKIFYHEAHPTHPLLPRVPCRFEENELDYIRFDGKVVVVSYQSRVFAYQQVDDYGRTLNNNREGSTRKELKPTAAVKRQLEKFVGSTFSSTDEFKAILFDEPIVDEPTDQVVSAAGGLDVLKKDNFVASGASELDENSYQEAFEVKLYIPDSYVKNGNVTIRKRYYALFENGASPDLKMFDCDEE